MKKHDFRIGVVFPTTEIEVDPFVVRDFVQTVEGLGYTHLIGYDHVLLAGLDTRPDWPIPYHYKTPFFEPMALFSYLAGLTKTIEFMSGVFILPQRQTVLFAKQAADVDLYCQGRLRLGVGIGWAELEYEALGVPYKKRGERLDDQIHLLRRLWTEETVTYSSPYHTITDGGLNPRPIQRPIPLWIGGGSPAAMNRAARIGDGWLPFMPGESADETIATFRDAVKKAGRDPEKVGMENIVMIGDRPGISKMTSPEQTVKYVAAWRKAGANGVAIETKFRGLKTAKEHLALLEQFARMLDLKSPS